MQLDRLAVQLRLRNPWEAMDLGFAMTRAWMPQVYGAWFAVTLPLFVLALVVLPTTWTVWVLWWCKPLLDRVVLHVLASGVFGELPSVPATLRALPRALTPGLLASLTWLRFAPARSFNLAVWQLERQRGSAAAARRRQLQRRVGGNAVWLTAVCMHFELAVGLSLFALHDLLVPGADPDDIGLFQLFYGASPDTMEWAFALVYFATVTLLEPAYTAAGFALYLNRRTALEGWDLELALRRMSQRLSAVAVTRPGAVDRDADGAQQAGASISAILAVTMCAVVLATSLVPASSQAQPAPGTEPAARDPAVEVREVYQRPELDPYEERTGLEWLGPKRQRQGRAQGPTWIGAFSEAVGEVVRVLAWIALGLALAFLLYYLARRLGVLTPSPRAVPPPPSTLFGLDVRPETLPADLAAAAAQLAHEGRILQALSLLYRGTLATLLHRDGVQLASGDTEADCLQKSRSQVPDAAHRYFAQLLAAWQRAAYARREVGVTEVERLCREWQLHFSAQGPAR